MVPVVLVVAVAFTMWHTVVATVLLGQVVMAVAAEGLAEPAHQVCLHLDLPVPPL
jgi:hypothetical protein